VGERERDTTQIGKERETERDTTQIEKARERG
jgi:hypothetical protein